MSLPLADLDAPGARRLSLPPLLFVALAFWAGVAATVELLYGAAGRACLVACAGGFVLGLPALPLLRLRRVVAACVLLGLALGGVVGGAQAFSMGAAQQGLLAQEGPVAVRIVRDARPGSLGATALGQVPGGATVRLNCDEGADLLVGDVVNVSGGWRAPSAASARSSWRSGVVAVAKVRAADGVSPPTGALAPVREFRRAAIAVVEDTASAVQEATGWDVAESALFLQAVVLGHVGGLYATALYQAVKVDGLAHLVAVSGAHLAIACGMAAAALRRLAWPRAVAIATQVMLVGGYLALTGAPVSAVRAAVMASLGLLSYLPRRRPYALGALSCCIIAIIALDASAAFSTSFLLSATATLGIVMFSGWFERLLGGGGGLPGLPEGMLREAVGVTFASSLMTGPVSACLFGQVSAISPLANVVAAPAFPAVCLGGFACIAAAVGTGPPGGALLGALICALQAFCLLLEAMAGIPHASFPAALDPVWAAALAIGMPAALWAVWPRPGPRLAGGLVGALALVVSFSLAAPFLRGECITMLDVGQGDAILVQSAGRSLLVDTGNQDIALLEGLASCGVASLDAVVITHPDDDHCASLSALKGVVQVGRVLVARDLLAEDEAHCASLRRAAAALVGEDGLVGLSVGERIAVGAITLEVVGPDAYRDSGGNADSVVLLLSYDADGDREEEASALLCGDAEAEPLSAYVAAGRVGRVDILKVGHHGSRVAVDDALLDVLQPAVALVSVGEFNRYGHPVPETLDLLEAHGGTVFRTDTQGTIACYLRPDGIRVHPSRQD